MIKFDWYPLEFVTNPTHPHLLHVKNFWVITNLERTHLLLGKRSETEYYAQGNSNIILVRRFIHHWTELNPHPEPLFMEHVYLPDSPSNY